MFNAVLAQIWQAVAGWLADLVLSFLPMIGG